MTFVDSHCHLDDPRFQDDLESVVERALLSGVTTMLSIGSGTGPPDLDAAIRVAERYHPVYATVGIHPHDARKATDASIRSLGELLTHPKVLALGEIGLDFYYENSPRETQIRVFIQQLELARDLVKPVIIHSRNAWQETLNLLDSYWSPQAPPALIHCFSGGPEEARQAIQRGLFLAFGGILTFPKANGVRQAARIVPADRLLLETDAPYLAPVPKRGQRNEPAFLPFIARHLAECRKQSLAEIAAITTENFRRFCLLLSTAGG